MFSAMRYFYKKKIAAYLYVPFTLDELSDGDIKDVEAFRKSCASKYKNKEFMILYHGQCDLSSLPKEAKIYVIGHGNSLSPSVKYSTALEDSEIPYKTLKWLPFADWAFTYSSDKKSISIDTIAERMIKDGLLHAKQLVVKLWFCDTHTKSRVMAKRFMEAVPKRNRECVARVDYYLNQTLYTPSLINGEMHKWAKDNDDSKLMRASLTRKSLVFKEGNIVESVPVNIDKPKPFMSV